MPYSNPYNYCEESAKRQGGKLCPTHSCSSMVTRNYTHAICYCQGPYRKFLINGVCPFSGTAIPVMNHDEMCFCCCGGPPPTKVSTAENNTEDITNLQYGSQIMTAQSPDLDEWSPTTVHFSNGVGQAVHGTVVHYKKENGEKDVAILNPRQPVLLADRLLRKAEDLQAEVDHIVLQDQSTAVVLGIQTSDTPQPHHVISTSSSPTTDLAGHLIVINGVVCADYSVQLAIETNMDGSDAIMA